MSQNIVAVCDVDWGYAGKRSTRYKAELGRLQSAIGSESAATTAASDAPKAQLDADARRPAQDERRQSASASSKTSCQRSKRYTRLPRDARQAEGHRRGHRRDAGSHARGRSRRPRWIVGKHVYVQKPLCWSVDEARHLAKKAKANPKIVTQMGNQGHSRDERPRWVRVHPVGAIGDVTRSPRLDEPSARLLAAGHAAPGAAARPPTGQPLALERPRRRDAARGRDDGQTIRCPTSCRGICSSASRRRSTTTRSITRSTGAAGWTGARARSATWARTSSIIPFWSLELGMPTAIETISTPFNGVMLSERDDDLLRVRRAREQAGREADVVRRRIDAAASPTEMGDERSSTSARAASSTSAARARCCTTPTATSRACCRSRCTTRTAPPKRSSRASRTRSTR